MDALFVAIANMLMRVTANFFKVIVSPGMEDGFRKRERRIYNLIGTVRQEVHSANMHSQHRQLASIENIIGRLSNTQATNETPSTMRMIPHSRNEGFFGRSSVLEKLDEVLEPRTPGRSQHLFALYGLGGSGKTQIALEYTYSRSKHYDIIIWILASSLEKIDQGFQKAAEQLGMDSNFSKDPSRAKDFVVQRLSSSSKYFVRREIM